MRRTTIAAGIAALALSCGPALAQDSVEEIIDLSEVPEAAMTAARAAAGDVELTVGNTETEGSKTVYELRGRMTDGMMLEVDVFADGTIEEVEREIDPAEVPKAVMEAVRAKYPGFRASRVEANVRDDQVVEYNIEGQAGGTTFDVEVTADGSDVSGTEFRQP